MNPTLPASRIARVSVTLTPAGAMGQSLSNLLVLGTSAVIDTTERYRIYSDLASVAADFGTSADEYLAAQKWFSQAPQPTEILIGRWVNTASQGGLRGATLSGSQQVIATWNAVVNGGFKYVLDGGALTNVTGLDFSGAANLNAVAGIIDTAIAGATCVWNATYQRFEFTSSTTGATSSFAFLVAPTAGTDISAMLGATSGSSGAYLFVGQAAEDAIDAVTYMEISLGQQWYALFMPGLIPGTDDDDIVEIAGFLQGTNTKHVYAVGTTQAGSISAVSTTDIGYILAQLGYSRTAVQYSSEDAFAVVSMFARILTTNYNGNNTVMTLKFKQEPGVIAEFLNTNQAEAVEAKNVNIFVEYDNGTAIIEQGVMSDGTFIDIVTGTDWLAVELQRTVYNLLYTSTTKIPQTDQGMSILTTACEAVCSQAVINGLLAPGVWNSGGFGQLAQGQYMPLGFYVYNAPVDTQNQADRAARLAMPIQIAAKLAGAIHSVDVAVTVNQ